MARKGEAVRKPRVDAVIRCMELALSAGDEEYADHIIGRGGYNGVGRPEFRRIKRALAKAGFLKETKRD